MVSYSMTSEVAIINREAIALAADSAVTVTMADGQKIYNSANKLFALSQNRPVGIMIYGSAQLNGVPWEALIKTYRKNRENVSFSSLQLYANDLFSFLDEQKSAFLQTDENARILDILEEIYEKVRGRILKSVQPILDNNESTESESELEDLLQLVRKATSEAISLFLREAAAANKTPLLQHWHIEEFSQTYSEALDESVESVFEELDLEDQDISNLKEIGFHLLSSDQFSSTYSGLLLQGLERMISYQILSLIKSMAYLKTN